DRMATLRRGQRMARPNQGGTNGFGGTRLRGVPEHHQAVRVATTLAQGTTATVRRISEVDAQFDGCAQPTGASLISPERRAPRVRGADMPRARAVHVRAGWNADQRQRTTSELS